MPDNGEAPQYEIVRAERVPSPDRIELRYESPTANVSSIDARSRAYAVAWGSAALIATVVLGLVAFVALDVARLETTIAGEIGSLAGLRFPQPSVR